MRGRACTLAVLALLLGAPPAEAASTRAEAKKHVKRGDVAYRLAKFDDALVEYQRALELHRHPAILFNIAQCHRQLRNEERALFYYRLFLSDWERLTPPRENTYRDEVLGHIARLERSLAERKKSRAPPPPRASSLQLDGVPAGAQVFVDGVLTARGPLLAALPVRPGRRLVRVEAESYLLWEKTLVVNDGQALRLPLVLQSRRTSHRTLWLGSSIAATALAAGAFGVGLAYNLKHNGSVARTDEADTTKSVSIAGYAVAGVMAGAAVVGWVLFARAGRPERRAAVLPLPGGAVAAAAVEF